MSSDPPVDDTVPLSQVPAPEADNSTALLSELDALLERMMALPVNSLDEETPAPAPRTEQPPADVSLLTVTEAMPGSIDTASLPPSVTTTSDDLYVQTLLHEHQPQYEAVSPEPPPSRSPEPVAVWNKPPPPKIREEALPAPVVPPMLPLMDFPAPPRAPAAVLAPSAWLLPLTLCNSGFDRLTTRLGTPGIWFQHPRGRTLLGWAGVLMIAVAGGLALGDCLGWTW